MCVLFTLKKGSRFKKSLWTDCKKYFGVDIDNQNKCRVGSFWVKNLRKWYKKENKAFTLVVPMVWSKQKNLYWKIDVSAYIFKNKKIIIYSNLISVHWTVGLGSRLPIPVPSKSTDDVLQFSPEFNKKVQL